MFARKLAQTLAITAIATAGMLSLPSVAASQSGIELGKLECNVAGGTGFVFGSSKDLTCTFTPAGGGAAETYSGEIKKFGIDIGTTENSVIVWGVVAAEQDVYEPGALAGTYAGVSGSASFGVGLGANALVGGSSDSFALQPISLSGEQGVNLAVGLASIELRQ